MQAKKCQPCSEKINCHDKIPWHFPDIGQMAKIPWHFFKIPWQFPDLEKILFFPGFSLTRGNPEQVIRKSKIILHLTTKVKDLVVRSDAT